MGSREGGGGLFLELDRQGLFEVAAMKLRIAQRIAGNDQAAAVVGDVAIECVLNVRGEGTVGDVGDDHRLVEAR